MVILMAILSTIALWFLYNAFIGYRLYRKLNNLQKVIIERSFVNKNSKLFFKYNGIEVAANDISRSISVNPYIETIWNNFKTSLFSEDMLNDYGDSTILIACFITKRMEECSPQN